MSFWVAGAVLGGGLISAYGANRAASTQAGAQTQAANTQFQMFNTINGQEQPFIQAGSAATNQLNNLLGIGGNKNAPGYGSLTSQFTPADFLANQDPGYQFQLQQGGQAIRNADTPGVGALSGAALKDLMSFNQGLASTSYQNAFNRFQTQQQNIYSRLQGIASLGQNAASNVGNQGTALAGNAGSAQAAAGTSIAAGQVAGANALGNSSVPLAYLLAGNGSNNSNADYQSAISSGAG